MKKKLKKYLIFFLLFVFIFQASYVFAFEIKYPSVPGTINPQEIEQKLKTGEIQKSDVLPLYFKYFFNLSLIIVVLICLGVIIYGGVLHITAGIKPAVLVSARQWIFSGLLGLLILFSSYLVLVTINPQLSILKLGREEVYVPETGPAPSTVASSTYFEVPTGKLIEKNLSHITATTTRIIAGITHWPDCDNDRTDCWGGDKGTRDTIKYCLTDDLSFTESDCHWEDYPDGCRNNEVMTDIKWPKCESGQMDCWGGDAQIKCCGPVKLTGCYTTSTPSCKDDEVLHQITRRPDCLWDLSGYQMACWDENRDTARCCTPKNVNFTSCYELQSPEVEGSTINKFVSELEKVKARSEDLKRNMELLEEATEACSCGVSKCLTEKQTRLDRMTCQCVPEENQCDINCDKDLIIERASSTKAAIGKLKAEWLKLVTLQIPIVIDYLEMKKAGMLMSLPEDEIDYGQFAFMKYLLELEGERKVEVEGFKGWPNAELVREVDGKEVTIIDPATFYFPYDKWENQQAIIETQRLNPILVFSNTTPAELNKMLAETIKDVLGVDIFDLISESDWEEIVRKSLEQGTIKTLKDFLLALADAISKMTAEKLGEKVAEKAGEKVSMLFEKKLALIAQVYAQTSGSLTEKLITLFTSRLEERLPPILQEALSTNVLDLIDKFTGGDIKKIFQSGFYDLLNKEIKDFLSTKMADLSPTLSGIVHLRIAEVLPFTIVADLLTSLNDFLTEKINEIKEAIWERADDIVRKVIDEITAVLLENLPFKEIISALMEGIELVISEIVRGYIEAYIMYYLDSFLKDVYKFQDKLDNLLTLILKDILPGEIKDFLEKDIESFLPKDARDFLHKDFIDFLPKEIKDILTKTLKDFLPQEIQDILSTSLASFLGIGFIFEKTLYDYFPQDLKDFFEISPAGLFPDELTKPLINFLPDIAKTPLDQLTQSQRQTLFYTRILDLLPEKIQQTPLEVLGMENARVMDLLDPDVALLVRIIEDYLRPDERPDLLNELIRILKKPLTSFIRDELNNPDLADTLNTPLYQNLPQDVKDALNKSFVDYFPELAQYVFNPPSDSLVDIINQHTDSEIFKILSKSMLDLLPQEIRNQLNTRLKDYLPDWLINKKLIEFLPESWKGTIADFLGLTDQDIEEAIDKTMDELKLDKEIEPIIKTMSERMSQEFTRFLIENIAEETGQKISQEKAAELTEKIAEDMNVLIQKAWGKIMSEGFILDSLKNL